MPENEPNAAPAAQPPAGQQPTTPTGDPSTPAQQPTTPPETPAAPSGQSGEQPPEIRNPEAYRNAQEAARYRTENKALQARIAEFEAAKQAAEEAQLSELEKAQKRLAEYQQREAQATLETQQRITQWATRAEAARLGINPDLAARLVDYSAIEYDDGGNPKNVGDLLGQAIQQFGLNPQPASSPAAPSAPSISPTNPPRQSGPLAITPAQYSDPAFKSAYMRDYGEDLLSAMNKGKVKIV